MAIVIAVAAIGLFFLPQLLGIGSPPPETGSGPSQPPVSAAPSGPLEATPIPAATPQIYIVKAGDNMSKIAALFGVSLDDLIAANRETHPNPDTLQIGDEVIIPTPAPDGFGGSPSPSAVP
jgi:LysM repeat protein